MKFRCGPCKFIAPFIEELAKTTPEVEFFKVDVDQSDDLATINGINSFPTIYFLKGGQKVAEVLGAEVEKIRTLVKLYK